MRSAHKDGPLRGVCEGIVASTVHRLGSEHPSHVDTAAPGQANIGAFMVAYRTINSICDLLDSWDMDSSFHQE